ncbi:MAG: NAD-dependent epimerase/dehydratase family protein [Magnetococcales bacterium]|nr:NAD-dependent epimerase/dehydratase family protein [Magnetococcales bacterium]
MATWLITGGCGFIGSHLADALLARGDRVRILDDLSTGRREQVSPLCEIVVGDVSRDGVVAHAMEGVDGCWHLAAIASVTRSNEAWVDTHRVNLTGSVQVLDAARRVGGGRRVPVVYASSAAVYGDHDVMPLEEGFPTRPLTAYGADKCGTELHARVAGQAHGVPTLGLRFFNVYGPRQDPFSPYSGVISIFVRHILDRRPITLFGDGRQTRDFVYVGDVVRFLMRAMERANTNGPVYNVCSGRGLAIVELARTLFQVCGHRVEMGHAPARAGDIRDSMGDPELAARQLGLRVETILESGLRQTLASGMRNQSRGL